MLEAPSCQKGLRGLISRKLGRCPRCMRASAFGTLAGWGTFAALSVIWPHPTLLAIGLLIATSFTLLLLAHLGAVMIRVASLPDVVHAGPSASLPAEFSVGRRAVLVRFGRAALWTAAFGIGLFRMAPTRTLAQEGQEKEKMCPKIKAAEKFKRINVGASTKDKAMTLYFSEAGKFCDSLCEPNDGCEKGLRCLFNGAVPNPQCSEIAKNAWFCTGTIINCGCLCQRR